MSAYLILLGQSGIGQNAARVLDVLLDISVRGALLILVAWGATRLLNRGPATLRHLIWASALGGMLLIPLFSAVIPKIHVGLFPTMPTSAPQPDPSSSHAFA